MGFEPIARRALCAADLGIAHLFGDFPAQPRGIRVPTPAPAEKTMPRPKQSSAFAGSAPPAAISMLVILLPVIFPAGAPQAAGRYVPCANFSCPSGAIIGIKFEWQFK
jgi:hypothetical protein